MYIYAHKKRSIYIYIVLYITELLSIYTIAQITEPASKIYWINQQVEPKPIYICIYIHLYLYTYIYTHIERSIYPYIEFYIYQKIYIYILLPKLRSLLVKFTG